MNLWKSMAGMVEVELTSADLSASLTAINRMGIEISSLQWKDDLTARFQLRRSCLSMLCAFTEKRGESLKVCRHRGIFRQLITAAERPVLVMGYLLLFILTLVLPTRILFVQTEGNESVPDRQILEAAERLGVTFGTSRRELRSEKIKNGLLSGIPQLQWAGLNTSGCVATISVRERTIPKDAEKEVAVSRIVAARDGYILSGTVEQGTGLFQPGQTVHQGQLLISGYSDGGFCIRAVRAQGEIFAHTNREICAVTPVGYIAREGEPKTKQKISLLIRKKRINLWNDSGISDTTCGRMYEEYYITLPGGFRLPVAICIDTYRTEKMICAVWQQEHISEQLSNFAQQSLRQQMIAGVIKSSSEQIIQKDGLFTLQGSYFCEEMIGREQPEQIGVTNGENN